MRKVFLILLILTLILSCSSTNIKPKHVYENPAPKLGKLAEFDFEFVKGSILLPITSKGDTRTWMLDNGAVKSVIDSAYAQELSYPIIGQQPVIGVVNTRMINKVNIPEYKLGDLSIQDIDVASINLHDLLYPHYGENIYGIIGTDFLSDYTVRIDIANKKLTFYDPNEFNYHGNGKIFKPALFLAFHFINASLDSIYMGNFKIDLGNNKLLIYNQFAKQNGICTDSGISVSGNDAAGKVDMKLNHYNNFEIDEFRIDNPIVNVLTENTGASALFNFAGNIGTYVFRHFVLYLDYKQGRVILEKGKDYDKKFPATFTGLVFRYAADYTYIDDILDNSPAQKSGFMSGDIIRKFNGKSLSTLQEMRDMRKAILNGVGQTFKMKVEREGDLIELELTPISIYDLF